MGFRNPFRITLDENDVAYVTDYSPDSQVPQVPGPQGTGRVEIVRGPANYGWPLCVKSDLPYYKWDFNTSTPLQRRVPRAARVRQPARGPQNTSRWVANGGPGVDPGLEYVPPITNPRSGTPTGTTRHRRTASARPCARVRGFCAPVREAAGRRSSARSCSDLGGFPGSRTASARTARRRTTTTRPTRARRSSRPTSTARSTWRVHSGHHA